MKEALILHIETATDICSVALSEGEKMLAIAESGQERSHATLLNKFIRDVMDEAGKTFDRLDAVAISKGPGSYTGLRIGVSTAKGLAYGLKIPLLSSGTLLNLAHAARAHPQFEKALPEEAGKILLCPMLDARRMEVYAGFYTPDFEVVREVSADIIDEWSYSDLLKEYEVFFFGNGSDKCREVIHSTRAHFVDNLQPSARWMLRPALHNFQKKRFEDVAYFEPFYLKDFVATTPKKKVL